MRRFSDEQVEDREFEIGGELFKWRYPYWEEFANRQQADSDYVAELTKERPDGEEKPPELTVKEIYKDFIDRIEQYIDPDNDGVNRWRALTKRKVDPVPAYQFPDLYRYLVEVTGTRPTETPSPSQNGQGQTEVTSTVA